MKVIICDACLTECVNGIHSFEPLVHIGESNKFGYVDGDGNFVSSRKEHYDLCNKCYNVVFTAAMNAFKSIVPTE